MNHFSYPDRGGMCAQPLSSQESSITTKLPQVCHLNLSGFHSAEINHLCQYDSRIIFEKSVSLLCEGINYSLYFISEATLKRNFNYAAGGH